jgi:hypothetical protein
MISIVAVGGYVDREIFGFLIARYRIAGYACELAAPSSGHLWDFPDQPSSPPTPCISKFSLSECHNLGVWAHLSFGGRN